jgi:hypothetical protein
MCPVYSVNYVTGLYLTPTLSQREREPPGNQLTKLHQTILSPEAIFVERIRREKRDMAAPFSHDQQHKRVRRD